jgi:hypothetical protein
MPFGEFLCSLPILFTGGKASKGLGVNGNCDLLSVTF